MHHDLPCACTTLRKASRAVSRLFDQELERAGLTTTQYAVLRALRQEEMPLSRLAERMVMDRTSLYRTLGPIERHGWITIAADAGGRTKRATLTPEGRAAMHAAGPAWEAAQVRIVSALGGARWEALAAALADVTGIATGETRAEEEEHA